MQLTLVSPNGDASGAAGSPGCPNGCTGYPATIKVVVTFTLNNANQIGIHYKTTDLSKNLNTVINLTNHSYFNLAGEASFPGSAYSQLLQINANKYTPTDTTQIPLGYEASRVRHAVQLHHPADDRLPDPGRTAPTSTRPGSTSCRSPRVTTTTGC